MLCLATKTITEEKNDDNYAEELINELIPWYLASEKENLILLEAAFAEKDFATLIDIGDKMYGHGSSYGFDFISILGKRIEIAAIQANTLLLPELITALKNYLEECCTKYKLD
jgi:HPt (histidine-containing phosphotransfer) domain-containing protein